MEFESFDISTTDDGKVKFTLTAVYEKPMTPEDFTGTDSYRLDAQIAASTFIRDLRKSPSGKA